MHMMLSFIKWKQITIEWIIKILLLKQHKTFPIIKTKIDGYMKEERVLSSLQLIMIISNSNIGRLHGFGSETFSYWHSVFHSLLKDHKRVQLHHSLISINNLFHNQTILKKSNLMDIPSFKDQMVFS